MIEFNLNINNVTFEELKDWFAMNWGELPITLDGKHKYYMYVENTVEIYINSIIEALKNNNGKPTRAVFSYKNNLIELYKDLQVLENWNAPMETVEKRFRI